MSYDLQLVDPQSGNSFPIETRHTGGTMPLGGYSTTEFNITYNYSWFYHQLISKKKGLRWLYGKKGSQVISRLEKAIDTLGVNEYFEYPERLDVHDYNESNRIYKYWTPTPGNAGAALLPLLKVSQEFPDGIWQGD